MKFKIHPIVLATVMLSLFGCKKDDGGGGGIIGPNWVQYTTANSPLFSNNIRTIFVDGESKVWIGTDNGASYFNKGNWGGFKDSLRYPLAGGGSGATVNSITQSLDGSIWFGMQGGGVIRYLKSGSPFTFKSYTQSSGNIPNNVVIALAGQTSLLGEVYMTTVTNGVGRFTPSQVIPGSGIWNSLNTSTSPLPTNNIQSVGINLNDNTIWFGTFGEGVVQYNGDQTWNLKGLPTEYASYAILSMAFDRNGLAWFAKSDSGVSVLQYSTNEWKRHYTRGSTSGKMPTGRINAVVTDYHDNYWFGSATSGLIQLQGNILNSSDTTWTSFTTSTPSATLPSNQIKALAIDGYGNLWIGTNAGIAVYNPNGTRFGN